MEIDERAFGRFVYVSSLSISRDGSFVTYVITKANFEKNEYENTVVIHELDGGRKFIRNASTPVPSPDGKRMVFTRKGDKRTEVFVAELGSMSEMKILEVKNVLKIEWNEDGRRLAILGFKRNEDEDLFFESDLPVWFDAKGFLDGERETIWIVDTEAMEVIEEIELDRFANFIWYGDEILVSVPHRENGKMMLWRNDIRMGDRLIFEDVSLRLAHSRRSTVVLLGKERKDKIGEHDYVHVWDGEELRSLTERLGLNNTSAKIDGNGRVFFGVEKAGRISLAVHDGGKIDWIFDDDYFVTEFDVSDDGVIAFVAQNEVNPGEIFVYRDGKVEKITSYNDLVSERLGLKEAKHFSFERAGRKIDGWYIEPKLKGEEKSPVVVFVHGGPKGMYGHRFNFTMQHLVSQGFYVVYFNPRGSSGYDEDFALEVVGRTGLGDFQDILRGIGEFLRMVPKADGNRIGITGISYGGFMTNWAVTQTKLFKAAVSENGVSDWVSMYGFSDISVWFVKDLIGEDPFENPLHRDLSPLYHAENVETPILLIHSLEDYRCPLDQSVMFYHALKDRGKEAYIAIFKKGAHGHSRAGKPRHRAKRHKLILEFFKRKLVEMEEGFDVKEVLSTS